MDVLPLLLIILVGIVTLSIIILALTNRIIFKMAVNNFARRKAQSVIVIAGLMIGILATSLIQSSSTTTSIVVGLVAGGALNLNTAIPIIMGANIGTTITNTLVSMGHVTRRVEFRRAFAASIVHDFFNICAVIVFFPIEIKYHIRITIHQSQFF